MALGLRWAWASPGLRRPFPATEDFAVLRDRLGELSAQTVENDGVVLRGQVVSEIDALPSHDGAVWAASDGTVRAVGQWQDVSAAAGPRVHVEDHRPAWIVPGMIDLHVHLTLPGDGQTAY